MSKWENSEVPWCLVRALERGRAEVLKGKKKTLSQISRSAKFQFYQPLNFG